MAIYIQEIVSILALPQGAAEIAPMDLGLRLGIEIAGR
jgi:hypothetical protein